MPRITAEITQALLDGRPITKAMYDRAPRDPANPPVVKSSSSAVGSPPSAVGASEDDALQRAADDLRETLIRLGHSEEEADARIVTFLATGIKQARRLRAR